LERSYARKLEVRKLVSEKMAVLIPIKRISAQKRIDPAIALMCLDFLCLVGTEPNHLIIGGKQGD
jgi:hypothetical protein